MNNISLDTTSFSEQLGIYDFFNVLLSGVIFVCGCSIVSSSLSSWLWSEMTFQKGLGIVLAIYVIGIILQEIGSIADRKYFNIYKGMSQSILKGISDEKYDKETTNEIIKNPILLERYRNTAEKLIEDFKSDKFEKDFDNDYISGFVFCVSQYYVSVKGKDKKVEKMRALFAMSKTLIVCFLVLTLFAIFSAVFIPDTSLIFGNIPTIGCGVCSGKIILAIVFLMIGRVFYFRAKRTMKNFLLILLGTYDAIIRAEENEAKPDAV